MTVSRSSSSRIKRAISGSRSAKEGSRALRGSACGAAYRPLSTRATALQFDVIANVSQFPHRLQEVTPQSLDAHARLVKLRAVRWQTRAKRKPRPIRKGSEGSERRSASMPGAARPEFDPVSAADVFSELSSDAPPTPCHQPRLKPILTSCAITRSSLPRRSSPICAPPSIPSAAHVTAEEAPKPQGSIPVLPGHVIANRYEVLVHLGRGRHGHRVPLPRSINGQFVAIKRDESRPSGNLQGEYVDVVLQGGARARRLGPSEHRASARLRAVAGRLRRFWRWSSCPAFRCTSWCTRA